MRDQTYHIVSYELVPLEDIAEVEPLVEDVSGPEVIPTYPYAIPLEDVPEVESLVKEDTGPETELLSLDHVGVATALSLLNPRERQVLAMKAGLDASGEPHKSADIADFFGLSVETVSSTLTRARKKLRAVPNILGIINGEDTYRPNSARDSLQTS